jgi:hypothetical protein
VKVQGSFGKAGRKVNAYILVVWLGLSLGRMGLPFTQGFESGNWLEFAN